MDTAAAHVSPGAAPSEPASLHDLEDRFVPLHVDDLAARLAADGETFRESAAPLTDVARAIEDVIEQETTAFERALLKRYAPFNADADTLSSANAGAQRTPAALRAVLEQIAYLLRKANFEQLSPAQIDAAILTANSYGLRVRLDKTRLEELGVWVRGRGKSTLHRRTWRHPLRGEPRTVDTYRRLATVSKLKDETTLRLKMFKEIPIEDVEVLLPHAEVIMHWYDRIRIFSGGAGALGSAAGKLLTVLAGGVLVVSQLLWLLTVGVALLLYRLLMGYRSVRLSRESQLTRHLYYQNLDNNAGVIHALSAMVAQEDTKEALLAYAILLNGGGAEPDALAERIESYLHARLAVSSRFDTRDALHTLSRLGLTNGGEPRVIPPSAALSRLREHWSARRTAGYHEAAAHENHWNPSQSFSEPRP
ncbi:hypothetical protein RAS1_36730 [Phycisphaerae bacterium RAS1]|nr:hypothetical protein RAS1_36730 [Phycisphaerae bacterium RAS1]